MGVDVGVVVVGAGLGVSDDDVVVVVVVVCGGGSSLVCILVTVSSCWSTFPEIALALDIESR